MPVICSGFVHPFASGQDRDRAVAVREEKQLGTLQWDTFDIRDGTMSAVVLFLALFFNSLVPETSSQDVPQRYVTTKDVGAARRSRYLAMVFSVFGSLMFFGTG